VTSVATSTTRFGFSFAPSARGSGELATCPARLNYMLHIFRPMCILSFVMPTITKTQKVTRPALSREAALVWYILLARQAGKPEADWKPAQEELIALRKKQGVIYT
jgi:hypothetical protein